MRARYLLTLVGLAMLLVVSGCQKKQEQQTQGQQTQQQGEDVVVLKIYPLDSMAGIISQSDNAIDLQIDPGISADGHGALKIAATDPATVRLFEVGDLDIENARLIYRAKLRTEALDGKVYLEMWCHFPQAGDFFSRGLPAALSGTNDWVTVETPFFLKANENPDGIKLNLVIDGTGTIWIDDIRLLKGPLQ